MIYSMTGYGSEKFTFRDSEYNLELKSLNSKSFEFSLKSPHLFRKIELDIRSIVQQELHRGKVELCINYNKSSSKMQKDIDPNLFKEHYKALKLLQSEVGENSDIFSFAVSQYSCAEIENEIEKSEIEDLKLVIMNLCHKLNQYREDEGTKIQSDFDECIKEIKSRKEEISQIEPIRVEDKKEKLKAALNEVLNDVEVDYNKLQQELVFYIEKYDISEEISRLSHHLENFNIYTQEETILGKKLGFLCQEIGREINTIGSKSNNIEIQNRVINMKDHLEKIKEQLGNVL